MLSKNSFEWNPDSEALFANLKQALSESPILALPDFSALFIVECDAFKSGIGVIFQQNAHPHRVFQPSIG